MDEAFVPFDRILDGMTPRGAEFRDDDAGVHSYVHRFEIDSPVELDVRREDSGALRIGSTPPLYYVDTSVRPSYHRVRFSAELTRGSDAG